MATAFAPIPLHHAVTIHLTKTNFLIWRAQLLPYLRSTKLLGYLDGSIAAPAQYVNAGAAQVPNPAYSQWYDQDQQVLSDLLSSISEEVLQDVVDATTSKEAWDTLQRMFSSTTRARIVQIRVDLATTKKLDLSTADYFRKIKGLSSEMAAAEMAAAGNALRDDEVIAYLLAGLGPDYDPFVTSMTTKSEPLTLDEVYSHLASFEARQLRHQTEMQLNPTSSANFAGRGSQRIRGRGDRGRGRPPRRGPHPQSFNNRGARRGNNSRSPCQICGKTSHTAVTCWYRMDESYQTEQPSAAMATSSSYKIDPNWYSDTGATDHITSDLDRLALRDRYHGDEQVQVGNGAGLQILHIGHSSINTTTRPLALRNILHVPDISKHLLSVHKFSRDNDVFFEFHPWHFSIKDRKSKTSLLEGRCESGLYPIKASDVAALKHALVSNTTCFTQWHARLGHPSSQVAQSILRLNNISCARESHLPVCNACRVAKSHQLPFPSSVHRSSSPLELIFSDVWGPAPQSVGGFKYYISFIDDFSKFSWIYLMHDRTEASRRVYISRDVIFDEKVFPFTRTPGSSPQTVNIAPVYSGLRIRNLDNNSNNLGFDHLHTPVPANSLDAASSPPTESLPHELPPEIPAAATNAGAQSDTTAPASTSSDTAQSDDQNTSAAEPPAADNSSAHQYGTRLQNNIRRPK
ncbi:Retrovirus-related Pol polyprotein from transposon RE1, partial [Sesamum alatum]